MSSSRLWCTALLTASVWTQPLWPGQAQTSDAALRDAVWAAVQPALPFPPAADDDMPADGRADARWLVRAADGADATDGADGARAVSAGKAFRVVDVVANPLNRENQARAVQAMEDIQRVVAAAERQAQAEFERTLGTTSRQHPTRELTGISLDDEGVAGQRADWDSRLIVEARHGEPRYEWLVNGPGVPEVAARAGVTSVSVEAAEYGEEGSSRRRRYRPAEARLFFGGAGPTVKPAANGQGSLVAVDGAGVDVVEVTLRGNAALVKQVVAMADWPRVAALVRR